MPVVPPVWKYAAGSAAAIVRPLTSRSRGWTPTRASNACASRAALTSPPTTRIVRSSGSESRMLSTLAQMSVPGKGPSATRTLVRAARRMSAIWPAASSGLTGFAIPAASAPNKATNACGTSGNSRLTTSPGPTPRAWNAFAACVTRPKNSPWLRRSAVSSGSALGRKTIAGASAALVDPIRNASYVLAAAMRSAYGTASKARRSASVASDGQSVPIRRSSRCKAVICESGGLCSRDRVSVRAAAALRDTRMPAGPAGRPDRRASRPRALGVQARLELRERLHRQCAGEHRTQRRLDLVEPFDLAGDARRQRHAVAVDARARRRRARPSARASTVPSRLAGSAAATQTSVPSCGRRRTWRSSAIASGSAYCSPDTPAMKRPPRISPRASSRR